MAPFSFWAWRDSPFWKDFNVILTLKRKNIYIKKYCPNASKLKLHNYNLCTKLTIFPKLELYMHFCLSVPNLLLVPLLQCPVRHTTGQTKDTPPWDPLQEGGNVWNLIGFQKYKITPPAKSVRSAYFLQKYSKSPMIRVREEKRDREREREGDKDMQGGGNIVIIEFHQCISTQLQTIRKRELNKTFTLISYFQLICFSLQSSVICLL